MQVQNAVIMAAGTSSRFTPLSYEKHKALTIVKGEVLIERQIRQLKDAGVPEILIVTGYKAEQFSYLPGKFGVRLIHNGDYMTRNNNGSIWAVQNELGASYICSSDNYFTVNPFEKEVDEAYYAALYSNGPTQEWCMKEDAEGYVNDVVIGGENAWFMLGHAFWSPDFSQKFLAILEKEYDLPETTGKLWENIYMEHLDVLKMKIRKYPYDTIYEFDSLDELREFDPEYWEDPHSAILKEIARRLDVPQRELRRFVPWKEGTNEAVGFLFETNTGKYGYRFGTGELTIKK